MPSIFYIIYIFLKGAKAMATAKKTLKVEVTSDNYEGNKSYEIPGFTQSQIDGIKKFLYEVGYVGVRSIRVVEA